MSTTAVTLAALFAALLVVSAGRPGNPAETYRVRSTDAEPATLLAGDEDAWASAPAIAWGPTPYTTRYRALHSPDGLWVRFDARDSSPWHTLQARDAHLWNEEVVEIFIDPDGDGANYAELEISPANVVTDLVIFQGQPDLRSDIDWNFAGLRSRVLEWREGDLALGWTAVALLPWTDFAALPSTAVTLPPQAGDAWRFNVFRIKRPGGPTDPERDAVYAAWSPPPGPSFHVPEVFRTMEFEE